MSETSLLQMAKADQVRFYLQFGGQGAPWLRELSRYYGQAEFEPFFSTVLSAIDEELHRVEGSLGLPQGLDIRSWLKDNNTVPSQQYLSYAAVSLLLILVTQLAHFENVMINGNIDAKELASLSLAASGHSQGIIAAAFVSLAKQKDDYYASLAQFVKYQLYIGVSAQKAYPHLSASQEESTLSQELGSDTPSPMAAVLGSDHASIEKLVTQMNSELAPEQKIYISLRNSPTNRILSSHRSSLIAFYKKYRQKIESKELKFVYLQTTCPFHSPFMEPILAIMKREIEHIGFQLAKEELKIPVYSFYDEKNYQELEDDLAMRMVKDLMLHPLTWEKALGPVKENSRISHILDFGPGKTSQRLSIDTLEGMGVTKPVLALSTPKEVTKVCSAE